MNKYLILDGHSLAYRAYFALSNSGLSDSLGNETHAIHGFYSMFAKLLEDTNPAGVAVAFDRPEPTFRNGLDPHYKEGRPETPESLIFQVEAIKEIAAAFNVLIVEHPAYEADDLIATISTRAAEEENEVLIVTGDRDSFQLVKDPYIRVLYLMHGVKEYVIYDEAGIVNRTEVTSECYPTLAALRGDPSDNLPGAPGIGPKTAAKLINMHHDLDGIYEHVEEYPPKQRESLLGAKDRVYLNLRMTLAVRDVPIDFSFNDLTLGRENRQLLNTLFGKYQIKSTKERIFKILDGRSAEDADKKDGDTKETLFLPTPDEVLSKGDIPDLSAAQNESLNRLATKLEIIDFFENQKNKKTIYTLLYKKEGPGAKTIISMATLRVPEEVVENFLRTKEEFFKKHVLQINKNHPWESNYLDEVLSAEPGISSAITFDPENLNDAGISERFGSFITADNLCISYALKNLLRYLLEYGLCVKNILFDVSLAGYLVDPDIGQMDLYGLADKFLDRDTYETFIPPETESQLKFQIADEADEKSTFSDQLILLILLTRKLAQNLKTVHGLILLHEIEIPLETVLAKMEFHGIKVDRDKLETILADLKNELDQIETKVFTLTNETFNLNSPKQLGQILYEKVGLTPVKKTKGKTSFSTDAASLEKLKPQHEIIQYIVRHRELEKLRSTYAVGLIKEIQKDGRIHATFHQTVARTGRLSSDKPNLHNIPLRTKDGKRFREAFVPEEGYILLAADYNQIELRIIAHLSKDPGLIRAFANNLDIHTATAASVYGIPLDQVTHEMRQKAKMVSYGLVYGMEAYGLAQRLGIEVSEAQNILESYFAAFPGVKSYMSDTIKNTRMNGYTTTLLNRRRYIGDLNSSNRTLRQAGERQAMNAGIQGLAADIFKIALINIDRALTEQGLKSRIVLQVHDEIILEVLLSEKEHVTELCRREMQQAILLDVPLEVNVGSGASWAEAKDG